MYIKPFQNMACPIDFDRLTCEKSSYVCANKHSFDISRYGYINLLPSQFKNSRNPGDGKDMVRARTNFLETGHYDVVLNAVKEKVMASSQAHTSIIDAGCGEGYYTAKLTEMLKNENKDASFSMFGYDISKDAITVASKRSKEISWAVATNNRIPVLDNSTDIILSLFGFPMYHEFSRILKNEGVLILINPGDDHLIELRERIYAEVIHKNKDNTHLESYENFTRFDETRCKTELKGLSGQVIGDLLGMTPHFYRMQKDRYEDTIANPPASITVDIYISCYSVSKRDL